ncbi:arginine deiminase-related protein [Algivirga pacifica]|uniref:Arginine deiminase-related protein n=2 Tax=Algivirga pacifica TaxID=1162670 RepID=A0ABP9DHF5_9BACT
MIRPASFGFNSITAQDNAFQNKTSSHSPEGVKQRAQAQFDFFVSRLREVGINVLVIEDTNTPEKPDAIFPNNWISTHTDGKVILYPMKAENRRLERREDIVEQLKTKFQVNSVTDLSTHEKESIFLEGTGSMIFDRVNKICYACISHRTDAKLLEEWGEMMGYEIVSFTSKDENGQDIYHTNVMLSVGSDLAVICAASIPDQEEQAYVLNRLKETGKTIIDVSFEQMQQLCCNVLEVCNQEGDAYLTMSKRAYDAFTSEQIEAIEKHVKIVYSPIPIIEEIGGGGSRCMMAEIFLPKK